MTKYKLAILTVENKWVFKNFVVEGSRTNLNTLLVASLEFMPLLEKLTNMLGILFVYENAKKLHPIMLGYQDMDTQKIDIRPCREELYEIVTQEEAFKCLQHQLDVEERNLCILQ